MKKIGVLLLTLVLFSCGSSKSKVTSKPLFEVLTQQPDGGGNIHFFEIVSTSQEYKMLQNDKKLKGKIIPTDINESNFLILNMGEKSVNGCTIDIEGIQETEKSIFISVKENEPKTTTKNTSAEYVYPYSIVKINSKKEIILR